MGLTVDREGIEYKMSSKIVEIISSRIDVAGEEVETDGDHASSVFTSMPRQHRRP